LHSFLKSHTLAEDNLLQEGPSWHCCCHLVLASPPCNPPSSGSFLLPALLALAAVLLLLLLQVVAARPQPQEAGQLIVRAGGARQRAITPALTVTGCIRLDEAAALEHASTRRRGGCSCSPIIVTLAAFFAAVIA
jgi:hypothetical protein